MKYFGNTHIGNVRSENQDNFQILELGDAVCLTVCDGMGGVKGGRLASALALKGYHEYISANASKISFDKNYYDTVVDIVVKAVSNAQKQIEQAVLQNNEFEGMGTTLVSAFVKDGKAFVVNVGDSRCYRLLADNFTKVTKDHSLVQQLVDEGKITEEEAEEHPRKNCITRAVGVNYDMTPDIFFVPSFEQLILCSDGLTNMVDKEEIKSILSDTEKVETAVNILIDRARENGGYDNITVVLIKEEK